VPPAEMFAIQNRLNVYGEAVEDEFDIPRSREMRTDPYTKLMLTIIALSLTVIAMRPFFSPGLASAQMNSCGLDAHHPCYIAGWPEGTVPIANSVHFPLKVIVGNPARDPLPVLVVNRATPMFHP
jgi:hypothetical protein